MSDVINGPPAPEGPGRWRVTRYADVRAALGDARLEVPTSRPGAVQGTAEWLRGVVSRFSNGPVHAARRAAAVDALAGVTAPELRRSSAERMAACLDAVAGTRIDLMPLARTVPVSVLAAALGVPADRVDAVASIVPVVAVAYPAGAAISPEADAAVARLADVLDDSTRFAALAGLLAQSCEATAGLIGNTLVRLLRGAPAGWPVDAVLAETLRHDPPVRATVRIAAEPLAVGGQPVAAGETLLLDLAAANRDPAVYPESNRFDPGRSGPPALTFGAGLRPCPGDRLAVALAAGVVEVAAGRCRLVNPEISYMPSPALRVPATLEVFV